MFIFQLIGLLVSIIIHEIAHGYVAYKLGDQTAKRRGRLTLNPIPHIDPLGSILIPGLLYVTGAPFFIGWAKPVPIDPRYFNKPYRDMMLVAIAGPISNILIGFLSLIVMNSLSGLFGFSYDMNQFLLFLFTINIYLAVFNMLPVPPLDGSRVITHFLPVSGKQFLHSMERYGLLIVFALIYFDILQPIIQIMAQPFFILAQLLFT